MCLWALLYQLCGLPYPSRLLLHAAQCASRVTLQPHKRDAQCQHPGHCNLFAKLLSSYVVGA